MMSCVVSSCKSNSLDNPNLSFFNFPKHSSIKEEWLEVLNLKRSHVTELTRICELHFKQMDICAGKKSLKTHAVPVHVNGRHNSDLDSTEDEFIQCESDSDLDIIEVKKVNRSNDSTKIKVEDEEFAVKREASDNETVKELVEQEPGRRPSRRAAQLAVKKIHNSVRNLALPSSATISVQREPSKATEMRMRRNLVSSRGRKFRDQRVWHSIRVPPADLDLRMECHEELLSPVQMDALVKAQNEYNSVMKRLRSLKASNARIICIANEDSDPTLMKPQPLPPVKPPIPKITPAVNIRPPNLVTLSPASLTHTTANTITVLPVRLLAVQNSGSVQVKTSPTVTLTATSEGDLFT